MGGSARQETFIAIDCVTDSIIEPQIVEQLAYYSAHRSATVCSASGWIGSWLCMFRKSTTNRAILRHGQLSSMRPESLAAVIRTMEDVADVTYVRSRGFLKSRVQPSHRLRTADVIKCMLPSNRSQEPVLKSQLDGACARCIFLIHWLLERSLNYVCAFCKRPVEQKPPRVFNPFRYAQCHLQLPYLEIIIQTFFALYECFMK